VILILVAFLNACNTVRKSAGVTRKSPDEFSVIENPPLVIPPDYNLIPPDQLKEKNVDEVEKELAEEILFGLEEKVLEKKSKSNTMNLIINEASAGEVSENVRVQIDEEFAKEIETKESTFGWDDEEQVLDAVKESERIRNKNFSEENLEDSEIPVKTNKIKKKKKFLFF
tara:strand:- start:1558 stop:2067 length:510 start_codon:yes stop_codon:yes gene_type:complete